MTTGEIDGAAGRAPRLADVARIAGVSVSTASRALSRPEMVAAGTRERVAAAAERVGFRFHPSARALTTGRTGLLALCVPTLANPLYAPVVEGAQRAAEEIGNEILVVVGEGSAEREFGLFERLRDQVDGFIAVRPHGGERALADLRRGKPLVVVNRRMRGVSSVVFDTPGGLREIAERLTALGHRRVAYIGGPEGSWMDPMRRAALEWPLTEAGGTVVTLGPYPPTFESGMDAAGELLTTGSTAAVAYNSMTLLGLLHRLTVLGVRVPDDLSLACADDLTGVGLAHPDIMALHVPAQDAGELAVRELMAEIDARAAGHDARPRHRVIPVDLVGGDAAAPPPPRPAPPEEALA
ncbi:LacI family transcriptional regulator [Actinoallomurus purpureus]|uniref:LacI family DNA-binding transcriptional regulator n=1 Tax=Actinoallomurus purpureus TaxID=478114 RepID=UPI002092A363|nr:LacI family DNA-binding transcriptional regulator [Actinoallomurus purpureus]MCO6009740.1 LacI family transcriptional regulator [Actinoallomurus purpureus]